jgi:predicted nucleic acid-binding protein
LKTWLVDTGPIVAWLDAADAAHERVATKLDAFKGQLVTTSAVITEAMHFAGDDSRGPRHLVEWVSASRLAVYDFCQPLELRAAVALMERYPDVPMDFADATLLLLAEAAKSHDILTLDRRGFSTFRTREGRPLRLVLDR